jgi:hypothetical protein
LPAPRQSIDARCTQALLSAGQPDFAGALDIYTNGRHALRDDGTTKRTM